MSSKKATKTQAAEQTYNIKDIVLAKVKGYPPWPAMVVDPENVAKHVKKERPPSKKTTFYCVRFFPQGDYSWAVAKDLSLLQKHEIEAYISEPAKKNNDLRRGYEIALNPGDWEAELLRKQEKAEAQRAEEEEGVDQLEESDAGEEELDSDASSATKKKKKAASKKRKRDSAAGEEQKKKRKSAQDALAKRRSSTSGKRSKKASSAEHVESEDGGDAAAGAEDGAEASKKSSKTSKARPSDAEGNQKKGVKEDEDAEDAALSNDPEALRVKEWRHKLQRAFLTGKPPLPTDMPGLDQIFKTVEDYPNLTIEHLQFSKIGKVMRRIANLDDIPRDDEFNFKKRAFTLVQKWQDVILTSDVTRDAPNGTAAKETKEPTPPKSKEEATPPKTNGVSNGTENVEMASGEAKDAPVAAVAEATEAEDKKDDAMDMSDS